MTDTWHAKEAIREIYTHTDVTLAGQWIDELVRDMSDKKRPPEVRALGKTLNRWKPEIIAWHAHQTTNGPTEGVNNLESPGVPGGSKPLESWSHGRTEAPLAAAVPA